MKSLVTFVALMFTVSASAMTAFPAGEYSGTGTWKYMDGTTGTYEVTMKVEKDQISSTYQFGDAVLEYTMRAVFNQNGFFSLNDTDTVVGNGYCYSVWCHFDVPSDGIEETVVFIGDEAYRLGSKKKGSKHVVWNEDLKKR